MRASLAFALGLLSAPAWAQDPASRAAEAPPIRPQMQAESAAQGVCDLPEPVFSPEAAAWEVARDGEVLRAVLTRPAEDAPRAVALLLHGYQGSRDEFPIADGGGLFERTAVILARVGIATVRFDFRGSGASDGAWADTTFARQTEDVLAVLAALPEAGLSGPVHLLGFSQGGLIALHSAAAQDGIASVTLWNPVLDPFQTYGRIFGDGTLSSGIAAAQDDPAARVGGTGLNAGFFEGINLADPPSSAAAYEGPILIVTGAEDRLAANGPENAERLAELRDAPTRVEVVAAGHTFGGTSGLGIVDRAIACSAAFMLSQADPPEAEIAPLQ